MKIQLRFFASLREALGRDSEQAEVPADVHTIADLRLWLAARGEPWASALGSKRAVRAALDQTMVGGGVALHDGAEVAFFPPVTGG